MGYLVYLCLLSSEGGCLLDVALTEPEGTSSLQSAGMLSAKNNIVSAGGSGHRKKTKGYMTS